MTGIKPVDTWINFEKREKFYNLGIKYNFKNSVYIVEIIQK